MKRDSDDSLSRASTRSARTRCTWGRRRRCLTTSRYGRELHLVTEPERQVEGSLSNRESSEREASITISGSSIDTIKVQSTTYAPVRIFERLRVLTASPMLIVPAQVAVVPSLVRLASQRPSAIRKIAYSSAMLASSSPASFLLVRPTRSRPSQIEKERSYPLCGLVAVSWRVGFLIKTE